MSVEVNTAEFEWSHGKKPRGEGYWCFEFHRSGGDRHAADRFFWRSGPYGTAVSEAKQMAKARGAAAISVMP